MSKYIAISDARAKLPALADKIDKHLERFVITINGQPKMVLMSLEELESIEETNEILAIPGALEEIKEGMEEIKKGKFVKLSDLK